MSRAIIGLALLALCASCVSAQADDPLLSFLESMADTAMMDMTELTIAAKLKDGNCDSCPYTDGVCCSEYSTCCPSSRVCVPVAQQPMCGPAPAPKNNNLNVYVGAPAVAPAAPAPAPAPAPGTADATADLLKQLLANQQKQPSMADIERMIRKELRRQLREEERKRSKTTTTTTTTPPPAVTSEPKPPKVVDTITHLLDIASKHAKVAQHNLNKAADAAVQRVNRANRLTASMSRDGEHIGAMVNHGLGLKWPKEHHQKDRSQEEETPAPQAPQQQPAPQFVAPQVVAPQVVPQQQPVVVQQQPAQQYVAPVQQQAPQQQIPAPQQQQQQPYVPPAQQQQAQVPQQAAVQQQSSRAQRMQQ